MNTRTVGMIPLLICTSIAGCGGGGDTTQDVVVTPPPAVVIKGIEGGGRLLSFGGGQATIVVGGKELDTTNPNLQVTVDAQPATLSDLRVGDQISYLGTSSDDGVTVEIESIGQDDILEGLVESGSIDLVAGEFRVLGQTVIVDALTAFANNIQPNDLSGINEGDFLEISGLLDDAGRVLASRIERESNDGDFEVTGIIDSIDTANRQFVLAGLTVDYANASLSGFAGGDPQIGDLVEVEGTSIDAAGVLLANEVERETEGFDGDEDDLATLEGLITAVIDANQFEVNRLPVRLTSSTIFEDGTATDIVVGRRVEVEGSIDSAGRLEADKVEFETPSSEILHELTGQIESIDSANSRIGLLGIIVQVTASTLLEGEDDSPLMFSQLQVGEFVEVRGSLDSTQMGVIIAAKLEREDDEQESEVEGVVDAFSDPEITVTGVRVITNSATSFEGDGTLTAAEFFSALQIGDRIEAEGSYDGVAIIAREVERDDD